MKTIIKKQKQSKYIYNLKEQMTERTIFFFIIRNSVPLVPLSLLCFIALSLHVVQCKVFSFFLFFFFKKKVMILTQ
jgi:hypothetical protein